MRGLRYKTVSHSFGQMQVTQQKRQHSPNTWGTHLVYVRQHPNLTIHSPGLTKAAPHTETFSDISALVSIRYAHQSEEEANSVRIARARTENLGHQANESDPEQEGNQLCPP